MSDKVILTGQSDEARAIADALGLSGFHVKSLSLELDPEQPITLKAVIYPTEDQIKALGGELEKFKGFGLTTVATELNYEAG